MFATNTEGARAYFARGFDSVTVGLEYDHMISAMKRVIAESMA
jgi:hypothetical protein